MQPSCTKAGFRWRLLVGCLGLLIAAEINQCYASNELLLSDNVREQVRRLSRDHSEEAEALEGEIADLVKQVKLAPPGPRKDEVTVRLKEKQRLLKTMREEYRRKLRELIGDSSAGTTPEDIRQDLESPDPAKTTSQDNNGTTLSSSKEETSTVPSPPVHFSRK